MDKKKWEQENVLRLVKKSRKGVLRVVFSRFGLMALLLILELVLLWMMWRWFNNDFEWFAAAQASIMLMSSGFEIIYASSEAAPSPAAV